MQEIKTPRLHGKSACETILSEFQTLHRVYLLIARSSWQKGITTQATVLRTFVFFSSCLLVCCNPRQPWRRGSDEPRSLLYATVLTTKVIAYRPEPLLAISGQPHVILEEPKTFWSSVIARVREAIRWLSIYGCFSTNFHRFLGRGMV